MIPPTIHELLDIEEFRRMMKTVPWLPENMRWGNPWRIWGLKVTEVDEDDEPIAYKWVTKEYPTYAEAWRVALKSIRSDNYEDVCVVSKRWFIAPTRALRYALELSLDRQWVWCARCRRPSYFGAYTEKHHALKLMPALTEDEPFRCYYCGIRRMMIWEHQ